MTECPKVRYRADSALRVIYIYVMSYRIGRGDVFRATEFLQTLAVILGLRTLINTATRELSNAILPA